MDQSSIKSAVYIVWDYLAMVMDSPASVDVMLLIGNRDDRTVDIAWELLQSIKVKHIVNSGGIQTKRKYGTPMWERELKPSILQRVCVLKGCSAPLLLEAQATHTGDNAVLSANLLQRNKLFPKSILIVTKPYMKRCALRTFQKQWPLGNPKIYVASMDVTFDDYLSAEQDYETVVNIMVGDLQRIISYPSMRFMADSIVPKRVKSAMNVLISEGYTKNLIF